MYLSNTQMCLSNTQMCLSNTQMCLSRGQPILLNILFEEYILMADIVVDTCNLRYQQLDQTCQWKVIKLIQSNLPMWSPLLSSHLLRGHLFLVLS